MSMGDKQVKPRGQLICCCKEADRNCYLTCHKGRKLDPAKVYNIPSWRKE